MIADFNPQTGQLDIYNGNQARTRTARCTRTSPASPST